MKRVTRIIVAACAVLFLMLSVSFAGDAPATQGKGQKAPAAAASPVPPTVFYGYVPPPPIREIWPGGFRVIFHELSNLLAEHAQGHY